MIASPVVSTGTYRKGIFPAGSAAVLSAHDTIVTHIATEPSGSVLAVAVAQPDTAVPIVMASKLASGLGRFM